MFHLVSLSQQGPPSDRGLFGNQLLVLGAAAIIILLVIVIIILLFPSLRKVKVSKPIEQRVHELEDEKIIDKVDKASGESPLDITIKLLHDDERRIVIALSDAGGSMLQKDISYELKLSRVKTHRTLVGLIERGIVTAEKHYNTNMITLSSWLINPESPENPKRTNKTH